jgi:hypothetical protein
VSVCYKAWDPVLILEKLLKIECLLSSMVSCLDSGEAAEDRVFAIKHGVLS